MNKDISFELQNTINNLKRSVFFNSKRGPLHGASKQVLFIIAKLKNGQAVMPSEISTRLGVTLPAVTHQINSLEKDGFIKRFQDKKDRRIVSIAVSRKGQSEVKRLEKNFLETIKRVSDHLGEKDTSELIRILKKISELPRETEEGEL